MMSASLVTAIVNKDGHTHQWLRIWNYLSELEVRPVGTLESLLKVLEGIYSSTEYSGNMQVKISSGQVMQLRRISVAEWNKRPSLRKTREEIVSHVLKFFEGKPWSRSQLALTGTLFDNSNPSGDTLLRSAHLFPTRPTISHYLHWLFTRVECLTHDASEDLVELINHGIKLFMPESTSVVKGKVYHLKLLTGDVLELDLSESELVQLAKKEHMYSSLTIKYPKGK